MRRSRTTTILYAIAGSGVALAFFGHGVLGAKGSEKFVALVTGNYDTMLGGTMSTGTATSFVNVIGWFDIVLAVVFAGLVTAAIYRKAIAYSPLAMGLFAWAALWGLLTALSRFTATLNGQDIWDVVERGPNYLAPAGLVYLTYRIHKDQTAKRTHNEIIGNAVITNGTRKESERALAETR
jgi:hypothetical protein